MKKIGRTHLVIPDTQVRPGVNTDHLAHIGNYIVEKKPDVIVQIGDFADMPSLSRYSVGKVEAEGCRYSEDIAEAKLGMEKLLAPLRKYNKTHRQKYFPRMILTLGNHENRITLEAESNPKFYGTISVDDLEYKKFGWEVYPFLEVAEADQICYSHYFITGVMGRPVSSAAALLRERAGSATMGHVQKIDIAIHPRTQKTALFCGVCYTHDETYLTPQGKSCKRGIVMKHEVHDQGIYDFMYVSLDFLKRNYS